MFASVAKFRFIRPLTIAEIETNERVLVPLLKSQPGYQGYFEVQTGERESISIKFWASQSDAEQGLAAIRPQVMEVFGSAMDGQTNGATANSTIKPLDLFRYSANGTRSYDTLLATTSYFSIDDSDSPRPRRSFAAAAPSASSTWSFPSAWTCCFSSVSPVRQFVASSRMT